MRVLIFNLLLIGTCCYAFFRGGSPERSVASLFLAAATLSVVSSAQIPDLFGSPAYRLLAIDIALLLGLTAIALKANRNWTMTVTAMQLVIVAVHLIRVVSPGTIPLIYAALLAIWSWPMVLLLLIGTFQHQRRLIANGADPSWSIL